MKKETAKFNIKLYKTGNYNVFIEGLYVTILSTKLDGDYPILGIFKNSKSNRDVLLKCNENGDPVYIQTIDEKWIPTMKNLYLESKQEYPEQGDMITYVYCDGTICITNGYVVKNYAEILHIEIGEKSDPEKVENIAQDWHFIRLATESEIKLFNDIASRYKFEPFDKVLVRNEGESWHCSFFSSIYNGYYYLATDANLYKHCIPYNEETKHLIGTYTECPKYDKPL